jgi:hypothetical protein
VWRSGAPCVRCLVVRKGRRSTVAPGILSKKPESRITGRAGHPACHPGDWCALCGGHLDLHPASPRRRRRRTTGIAGAKERPGEYTVVSTLRLETTVQMKVTRARNSQVPRSHPSASKPHSATCRVRRRLSPLSSVTVSVADQCTAWLWCLLGIRQHA